MQYSLELQWQVSYFNQLKLVTIFVGYQISILSCPRSYLLIVGPYCICICYFLVKLLYKYLYAVYIVVINVLMLKYVAYLYCFLDSILPIWYSCIYYFSSWLMITGYTWPPLDSFGECRGHAPPLQLRPYMISIHMLCRWINTTCMILQH